MSQIKQNASDFPSILTFALIMLGFCVSVNVIAEEPASSQSRSTAKLAARNPDDSPIHKISVLCVDAHGDPVAGAEVHLFQHPGGDNGHYLHFGPFTSDAEGRTECAEARFTDELGDFDRFMYARVPGRIVGIARSTKWKHSNAFNPECRVALHPSRTVEGHVTIPPGFDPTKVTVRAQTLHLLTGAGDLDFQSFPREDRFPGLDTALPEIFDCHPDGNGHIRFNDVPVLGRLYLVTIAEGLGQAQWRNEKNGFEQPIQLTIGKESTLAGKVLSPDNKPVAGAKVTARLSSNKQPQVFIESSFLAITNEKGEFAIHGFPDWNFVLYVVDPNNRWTFRPCEDLFVRTHEHPDLPLTMETGVLVSGRVLDQDGKPVDGAAISAVGDVPEGVGLADDVSDASGHYQLRLPVGLARLYFNSLPGGFTYPTPQIVKQLDVKSDDRNIENLDFTIPWEKTDAGQSQSP